MDAIEQALSTKTPEDIAKAIEAILSGEGEVKSAIKTVKMALMYSSEALDLINTKCAIKKTPASEQFARAFLTRTIKGKPGSRWYEAERIILLIVKAFPDIARNTLQDIPRYGKFTFPWQFLRMFFRVLPKNMVCSGEMEVKDLAALFFVALKIKKDSWDRWDVYKKHLDFIIADKDAYHYHASCAARLLGILPEDARGYTISKFLQAKDCPCIIMAAKNIPASVMWQAAQKIPLNGISNFRLRSKTIIPDKVSGVLLCKTLIRLSLAVSSTSIGMIVGIPSEEEFKRRTLELRLANKNKELYERALESRQMLENINTYGKKYNDKLSDILPLLYNNIEGISASEYLIGMCRIINSNTLWDALPGLIKYLYKPARLPEKEAKKLYEAVLTIKKNAHLVPAA